MVQEIKSITQTQEQKAFEMTKEVDNIATIAEETSASTEESAAAAEEQAAAMEGITSITQQILSLSIELQTLLKVNPEITDPSIKDSRIHLIPHSNCVMLNII